MIKFTYTFVIGATRNTIQLRLDMAKAHDDLEHKRGELREVRAREQALLRKLAEKNTLQEDYEELTDQHNELLDKQKASRERWDNLLDSPMRDAPPVTTLNDAYS